MIIINSNIQTFLTFGFIYRFRKCQLYKYDIIFVLE